MSESTSNPTGTDYELVQRLKTQGVTREQMLEQLKARGHSDEDAKVLVNAVIGRMPEQLPEAQLSPGTNILSPGAFTLSDVGFTGPAHVVGLYWIAIGAAILLALGIATVMTGFDLVRLPEDVAYYGLRAGGFVSMCAIAWGAFRYSQGVTIRRKPE